MQFNSLPALALPALSHYCLIVDANSGYASSCNSLAVYPPGKANTHYTLVGDCREPSGQYTVNTQINLGSCFGNSGGNLVAQLGGGFGASCSSVTSSGTILKATCGNGAGGYVATSIDMNNYIGNTNGGLYCYNQNGF